MVIIDKEKCIGCGLCASDCCAANIRIVDGKAELKRPACIQCGHCVAICPQNAVSIPEYDMADVEASACGAVSPDELLRAIKSRRSIRRYTSQPVSESDIALLIQAARYTATAKNRQDNGLLFIQDRLGELKAFTREVIDAFTLPNPDDMNPMLSMYAKFNSRFKANPEDDYLFQNAPLLLVITGERALDAGMAAQNIENMAAALGLGVLFNGFLQGLFENVPDFKKWLGVEGKSIQCCMLLGHPDVAYPRTAPRAKPDVVIM